MRRKFYLVLLTILVSSSSVTWASVEEDVVEQVEGARNIKAYQGKREGTWLPVPIPVANPTIGAGLLAALLYLHPQTSSDPTVPNATSGIVGMYTDTDSWFAGGFHDGNMKDDLYRFRVLAGTGEFNLDYFGIGDNSNFRDNPIPYSITTDALFSQILRQLPAAEDWYLGVRYIYINSNVVFNIGTVIPDLPSVTDDMTTSSLGIMANYDTRDDNYYPTTGSYFQLVWTRDKDTWGSDFDFNRLASFYNYYYSPSEKGVLAFRGHVANVHGDVPFYYLPTLRLRGFPAGQYRDNSSLSGHIEWRHKVHPRWAYILFYEAGNTADTLDNIFETNTINAYGGGVRWQVTEDKLLNLGIDVGFSDDDYAVYVQVGEKF